MASKGDAAAVEPSDPPVFKATVWLGNVAAKEAYRDEEGQMRTRILRDNRVTTAGIRARDLGTALADVIAPNGLWANQSAEPPAWVASDHKGLESLLAEHYGCPAGIPRDVEETHYTTAGPPTKK